MRTQVRVVLRQAWRNLRARPGQALLVLVSMSLATTTLAMAVAVNRTGDGAWDRVWRTSRGGDVIAWAGYDATAIPASAPTAWVYQQLAAVRQAPGVADVGGPFADLTATSHLGPADVVLSVSVRDSTPSAIDRPLVTGGGWLGSGEGVVLEDALATILGVRIGDTVTVAGQSLPVIGTALATSAPRYRPGHVGYAWVNQETADRLLAAGAMFQGATMAIRLADPSTADSFVRAHQVAAADPSPAAGFEIDTAAHIRDSQHEDLATLELALLVVGTALALVMVAITAVLVTARVAAHGRQIGALKAIGVSPGQLAAIVLTENFAIALAASLIGVVAGDQLSPLLARTEGFLYGAPQAPPVSATTLLLVAAVAVGVVALATIRPVLLGVRATTLQALRPAVRAPRSAEAARPGARPWQFGLRAVWRRPTRSLATLIGGALAVGLVTLAVALRSSQAATLAHTPHDAATRNLLDEIHTILVVAGVTIVGLALVNATIVAVLAARDGARSFAIIRALGATPAQTAMSFLVGQLIVGLLAVAIGIPTGVAVFDALRSGLDAADLSAPDLLTLAGLAIAAYITVATVPAVALARRPVAPQLSYE